MGWIGVKSSALPGEDANPLKSTYSYNRRTKVGRGVPRRVQTRGSTLAARDVTRCSKKVIGPVVPRRIQTRASQPVVQDMYHQELQH